MYKIQKKIFPLISLLPNYLKFGSQFQMVIPTSKQIFKNFSTQKEEFSQEKSELQVNPIIEKDDQEDFQNLSNATKKSVVIEQDLYNYESTTPKEDPEDTENPFVYPSKYGLLKLIACPISHKLLKDIKGIHYFNDKVSTNYMRKILKADKKCLLVFEPDTHYKNLYDLYQSVDKMLKSSYYGTKKKPRNPFLHCKSPKEIFNLNRRILIELKQSLNKIVFMMNYDGSIRLKGNVPSTNLIKPQMMQKYKDPNDQFAKHDYLIPFNIFLGMVNAESLEKKGIPIKVLNEKKIYPLYGVWSPTKQGYLDLLNEYIDKNIKKFQQMKTVIDLGCGTGILSFILLLRGEVKKVYGIDKSLTAVRNSRLNAEILEIGDKFKGEKLNLKANEEEILKNLEKLKFPKKYDLIISNPPWIVASYLNEKHDLDNGVYDPEENLLKASFTFASKF